MATDDNSQQSGTSRTPNSGTPINTGFIARVTAGLKGFSDGWFSPMKPIAPAVTPAQQESVEGRQFDYPTGYNINITPRSGEAVSFSAMRALADGYDLLRIVIESRKDQIGRLKWNIKPKDPKAETDPRCETLTEFFQMPDQEHLWDDWLRMLIEDLLVLDAPVLYKRLTNGGQIYGYDVIDGATIKRIIDDHGRTPVEPAPAYQQILKGVPVANYTTKELLYRPRNIRSNRVYGYSPVEQIIITINIALRRQVHQLQFYTEGSTPDLIFSVPSSWNVDQIKKFKIWWDSVLQGNTGSRRGTMFVPDGAKPMDTKERALKDEYDEWLARVVCYAFSVSPQAFVKQMNRGTANTAQAVAEAEGIAPLMVWVKNMMDWIIARDFGYKDLEFAWHEEVDTDPLIRAQVNEIYIGAKVLTPDEVRADLGKDPLTTEEREAAFPAPVSPPVGSPDNTDNLTQSEEDRQAAAEKLLKKKGFRKLTAAAPLWKKL